MLIRIKQVGCVNESGVLYHATPFARYRCARYNDKGMIAIKPLQETERGCP